MQRFHKVTLMQLLGFSFLCFRENLAANTAPTTNLLALCGYANPGHSAQTFCTAPLCFAFEERWQAQCASIDLT